MKMKSMIHSTTILCSLVIFLVFAIFAWASNINSKNPAEPNLKPSVKSKHELYNELLQLKETIIQQRKEVITKLMNIVKDPNNREDVSAIYMAVDILGEIRAIEASDILLDMVAYRGRSMSPPLIGAPIMYNLSQLDKTYPAIGPIIKIHP